MLQDYSCRWDIFTFHHIKRTHLVSFIRIFLLEMNKNLCAVSNLLLPPTDFLLAMLCICSLVQVNFLSSTEQNVFPQHDAAALKFHYKNGGFRLSFTPHIISQKSLTFVSSDQGTFLHVGWVTSRTFHCFSLSFS